MGEATYGEAWLVCNASPSDKVWDYSANPPSLTRDRYYNAPNYVVGNGRPHAWQSWFAPIPSFEQLSAVSNFYWASPMACTLEPMNKNPVTHSWVDNNPAANFSNCNKSQPSAPGTTGMGQNIKGVSPTGDTPQTQGLHLTSNFRSDHSSGCNFLFADGSVHFLNEDIDMLLYQKLSTMQGGEIAEVPE
jgi:prepilin-type processing-associated H-X9-DG protein